MSRNSLNHFPSVKSNTQQSHQHKNSSNQDVGSMKQFCNITNPVSNEAGFGDTINGSDKRLAEQTGSHGDIAKKIQSKLRKRKASGSDKKTNPPSGKELDGLTDNTPDPIELLKDQIEHIWENGQEIYICLTSPQNDAASFSPELLKQQIIKDVSFILCQVTKGQQLESVIIEKIKRKLKMNKCVKKCQQKEKNVNSMFDDRLAKLSIILRTR